MTRGVAYTKHMDETLRKGIYETQVPSMSFLYERSTTKNPEYDIGDRVCLPDGRVFRYAKASGTLQCDYGCKFSYNEFIEYAVLAQAQDAGDNSVTITVSASAGGAAGDGIFAEDEMRGGYIAIFHSGLGDSQNRGVVGNTAKTALGTSITVYLDTKLDRAVTTSEYAEVLGNPYGAVADLHAANDAYASVAGLPNVPATDLQYCWIQTWGPRWMSPTGNATGGSTQERDVYFDTNGAISEFTYGSDLYDRQRAGFLIGKQTSGTDGSPFIMLQVSS